MILIAYIQPNYCVMTSYLTQHRYRALLFLIIGLSLITRLFYLNHNELLVEEAYYWNYAEHLDFGYLDHPPMVALLIKLGTTLLGTNELGVRLLSLFCWFGAAFFSFKLTELIQRGAGIYAMLLLSILPFFFLHSLVITPDAPLTLCWSAALYYLYRALVQNQRYAWYLAGISLGLGLFSKYTILLLGPATLLYMLLTPSTRRLFLQKEPYCAAFIALLFFTPVVYWNATHEWASFAFQSTRRLHATPVFALHHLIGLILFFLMPTGVLGLWLLFRKNTQQDPTTRFLQIFTLVPLVVFSLFSLRHDLKFNWIGPGLLALIPWFSTWISNSTPSKRPLYDWIITSVLLLIIYNVSFFVMSFGTPNILYQTFGKKFISWNQLTQQLHAVAKRVADNHKTIPIFVPLDTYNIGSELLFYQAKLLNEGQMTTTYPIIGRHIFGGDSLMYRYWDTEKELKGRTLILISNSRQDFNNPMIETTDKKHATIHTIWARSPVKNEQVQPYYYQIIKK